MCALLKRTRVLGYDSPTHCVYHIHQEKEMVCVVFLSPLPHWEDLTLALTLNLALPSGTIEDPSTVTHQKEKKKEKKKKKKATPLCGLSRSFRQSVNSSFSVPSLSCAYILQKTVCLIVPSSTLTAEHNLMRVKDINWGVCNQTNILCWDMHIIVVSLFLNNRTMHSSCLNESWDTIIRYDFSFVWLNCTVIYRKTPIY